MPIRTVKQYSDRGSIKNLSNDPVKIDNKEFSSNIRLAQLYEFSQKNKDQSLESALGFITTDYISDKNALPLSIYRLRKIVADIKSKSGSKIDQLSQELSFLFEEKLSDALGKEYIKQKAMIKTASSRKPPLFWRASK